MDSSFLSVEQLGFTYAAKRKTAARRALDQVSFSVARGSLFGVLGPNGSGKSTLFQILATWLPLQDGRVQVGDHSLEKSPQKIREQLGVLFQSPSLDGKLTVRENLMIYGALFGISKSELSKQVDASLERHHLADRSMHAVETLSGGLKRRVELAKCLLGQPQLLLLDEPTTGLDPVSRRDFWKTLNEARAELNITCLVTTHDMEEAARCDRLILLDQGKRIVEGTPAELTRKVGGDVLTFQTRSPDVLTPFLKTKFSLSAHVYRESFVRLEHASAAELLAPILQQSPVEIESVRLQKPTLEDVFMHLTGHAWEESER